MQMLGKPNNDSSPDNSSQANKGTVAIKKFNLSMNLRMTSHFKLNYYET